MHNLVAMVVKSIRPKIIRHSHSFPTKNMHICGQVDQPNIRLGAGSRAAVAVKLPGLPATNGVEQIGEY